MMSELETTELGEPDFWSVILSIIQEKANKKAFFYGRRTGPSLDDVEMMLAQLNRATDLRQQVGQETWT